jgi:hypothetical protein
MWTAIKKTPDGFTYVDPAQFNELFAADLPGDQAAFMARSQVMPSEIPFSGFHQCNIVHIALETCHYQFARDRSGEWF